MFKERLLEMWKYIRVILVFVGIIIVGTCLSLLFLKILEVTILGEKGVEYLLLGTLYVIVGGIMLLIFIASIVELVKYLKQFVNWLFIEPYKARKLDK